MFILFFPPIFLIDINLFGCFFSYLEGVSFALVAVQIHRSVHMGVGALLTCGADGRQRGRSAGRTSEPKRSLFLLVFPFISVNQQTSAGTNETDTAAEKTQRECQKLKVSTWKDAQKQACMFSSNTTNILRSDPDMDEPRCCLSLYVSQMQTSTFGLTSPEMLSERQQRASFLWTLWHTTSSPLLSFLHAVLNYGKKKKKKTLGCWM